MALTMKKIVLVFTFLLISAPSCSGEWIAVDGGVLEIDLMEKEVEDGLWDYLANQKDFEFLARDKYTYQYQARTEKELYINAFCESFGHKDLHKEFLVVEDGGSCFFQAIMNLDTGEFNLINVNGVA